MRRQGIAPLPAGAALRFLYEKKAGRGLLKLAASRPVSILAGRFMDSPLSKPLIKPFAGKNGIVLEDYLPVEYDCFNAFFCRPIRKNLRPIPDEAASFMAPCDGLLSAYTISDGLVLPIKQSRYTIADLLGDDPAAAGFRDGICLVFRLCVQHYHRYALPVFTRNCREYTIMDTQNFGRLAQIEVGAMLVGRVENYKGAGMSFRRGEEKGRFLYGGSTVVLLLQKERVELAGELFENTENGLETPVKLGEVLGQRI